MGLSEAHAPKHAYDDQRSGPAVDWRWARSASQLQEYAQDRVDSISLVEDRRPCRPCCSCAAATTTAAASQKSISIGWPRNSSSWRAESRGFRLSPANVGPISKHAVAGLQARGIEVPDPRRHPQVVEARLRRVRAGDCREGSRASPQDAAISALGRPRRLADSRFHCAEPEVALVELERRVRR